ncbi:MAG: BCSC C-terminal domain-containing protein [Thiobacillus sp.]|nr:BCSC C-terminal domain-containing protein [Thiobacillus sp.]
MLLLSPRQPPHLAQRWAAARVCARPLCLAAAFAYAVDAAGTATLRVEYHPQPGVHIEYFPQGGLFPPQQPAPVLKAAVGHPPVAKRPASLKAVPKTAGRTRHAARGVESALRLSLTTDLQWPPQTRAPAPAQPPQATPGGLAAALPVAWQPLLDALQHDEQGTPQPQLGGLIELHGDTLRAQADPALKARLGWALYRAQRFADAAAWFQAALSQDPGLATARQGAFYALQRAERLRDAFEVADRDPALRAARADVAVQLALRERQNGDLRAAVHWLQQAIALGKTDVETRSLLAWSALQAGETARAAGEFGLLYDAQPNDANAALGLYQSLKRAGQTARIAELASKPGAFADLVRRDEALSWRDLGLARDAAMVAGAEPMLAGAAAPSVAAGAYVRSKSGTAGTSRLRIARIPTLSLRYTNQLGAWDAAFHGVSLDAGGGEQDAGVGGTVSWRSLGPRGWVASLGNTPTAGPLPSTWTGSVGWRDIGAGHEWNAVLHRSPVEDSVLSLAGLRDGARDRAWGRVSREGLTAGGYRNLWPQWNGSARLDIERLVGENVAANTHVAAGVGFTRDLPVPNMRFFSVGPALAFERYRRNLAGFGWGAGGYFSPQAFSSATLQAVFETENAQRWLLAGQVQAGWQSVREDSGFCSAPPCESRPGRRSSGIGTSAAVQWSVLLAPRWAIEGGARLQTGPAYEDRAATLALRYFFDGRKGLFSSDLPRDR